MPLVFATVKLRKVSFCRDHELALKEYKQKKHISVCASARTDPCTCGAPQGFWGSGEKGYLFSGSWGAQLIILGELGSKHILLGI